MVMRLVCLVFGILGAAMVIGIVARYGYLSSSTHMDGLISAGLTGLIAAGALGGHAIAVHIWRGSKVGGLVIFLIATAALLVNLSNSLGFIAGRSDAREAERTHILDKARRDNAALDRLIAEREQLPPYTPVTVASVAAAKVAVEVAREVRLAECKSRGRRCRQREADEGTARNKVVTLETDLGLTTRAAVLDHKIDALRKNFDKAAHVSKVDAQVAALQNIFKLPEATVASYHKLIMAAVAELLIVGAFLAVGLWPTGTTHQTFYNQRTSPPARVSSEAPKLMQADSEGELANSSMELLTRPEVHGEIPEFTNACLEKTTEGQAVVKELYAPYEAWCAKERVCAFAREEFEGRFLAMIEQAGFPHSDGTVAYIQLRSVA